MITRGKRFYAEQYDLCQSLVFKAWVPGTHSIKEGTLRHGYSLDQRGGIEVGDLNLLYLGIQARSVTITPAVVVPDFIA